MEWEDFAGLSETGYKYPRLSERQRALILSALAYLEVRDNWPDISDVDWDAVEEELAKIPNAMANALTNCDGGGIAFGAPQSAG